MAGTSSTTRVEGLTSAEVAQRVEAGQHNGGAEAKTKSVGAIVRDNVCTLFNAVNLFLAICIIYTGSYRNLLFLLVVFANLFIGIVQELRSKAALDKLSIVARRGVRVRRDGQTCEVPPAELVLDDIILLGRGDQVPADAIVVSGEPSMNESLLTGESDDVPKTAGDKIMSGSFVSCGTCVARISAVGQDCLAARIAAEAKQGAEPNSQILFTLKKIIKAATIVLVPLGIGLYVRSIMSTGDISQSLLSSVAAMGGMIPQGLILLTSTVLAIATVKLTRKNVLVQQLYCIESLARVDVLCLDKTGTITTGAMEVTHVTDANLGEEHAKEALSALAAIAASQVDDANETAKAILAHVCDLVDATAPVKRTVPFSSARKYSGVVLENGEAYAMGAARFVLGENPATAAQLAEAFGDQARVLVIASCEGFDDDGTISGTPKHIGFVAIRDQIRDSAEQTMAYFVDQGVTLKVISGDDPATVSAIARHVGVPAAESYVDATTLGDAKSIAEAVERYSVFGRVTPEQKRELCQALQDKGHTVAMTGDGVNDVLALKGADCSVAMAAGSDAARNVAEIVLIDNDFAHMPEVVAEGRRSINNLTRSASLFLVKTVFSAVVALACIFWPPYPFMPIQLSLISAGIIGIPSFILALEPNHDRVRGHFLVNVLSRSLPASLAITFSVVTCVLMREAGIIDVPTCQTLSVMLTALVGVALIFAISRPLNPLRATLLVAVVLAVGIGVHGMASFFGFVDVDVSMWVQFGVIGAVSLILFGVTYTYMTRSAQNGGSFARLIQKLED